MSEKEKFPNHKYFQTLNVTVILISLIIGNESETTRYLQTIYAYDFLEEKNREKERHLKS